MTEKANYPKAFWIAYELNMDADDVLDILLGNITTPTRDVARVETESVRYDQLKEQGLR